MSIILDPIESLEFEVPDGKGGTVVLVIPPQDGIPPADIDKINTQLEAMRESKNDDLPEWKDPNKNGIELMRFMLRYFNPQKVKQSVIDGLAPRHLSLIDKHFSESAMKLGES